MKESLRQIPPIHELQKHQKYVSFFEQLKVDSAVLHQSLTKLLNEVRQRILDDQWHGPAPASHDFLNWLWVNLEQSIREHLKAKLKRVINATGTVLHTNLGRAPLSHQAIWHIVDTASSYSNLEYNLADGTRGSRHDLVEEILCYLSGAEAAMIVNNNAAAVYLVLRTFAKDQEVIVSRGELVEIGGSFRVSSIMEESGAILKEVGTTNKTHLHDYENAITEHTAMIMKVHTSNFKMIGFTHSVNAAELVSLKKDPSILIYEDLGSGVLYDFQKSGIGEEPTIQSVIESGVDLVSFSGDKLLGGPQAGIILGNKEHIAKLKKHSMARALRVDKMTLAGLEGTLQHYLKGETGIKEIPAIRSVLFSKEEMEMKTNQFIRILKEQVPTFQITCKESFSQVGGGTMPEVKLESFVVSIKHNRLSANEIEQALREATPPIIVKIREDKIQLDLRTVGEHEYQHIVHTFALLEKTLS